MPLILTQFLQVLAGALMIIPSIMWTLMTYNRWRLHRREPEVPYWWPPSQYWWITGIAASNLAILVLTGLLFPHLGLVRLLIYPTATTLAHAAFQVGQWWFRRRLSRCRCEGCVIARHEREFR